MEVQAPEVPVLPANPVAPAPAAAAHSDAGLTGSFDHPVVCLDPRAPTLRLIRRLRQRRVPLVVLTSRRLEPAAYAAGVQRQRLPDLAAAANQWEARLIELAARLEPRPILAPCSRPAIDFVCAARLRLAPHFVLTNLHPVHAGDPAASADAALRGAVMRGQPAFEVQVTLDREQRCTGSCVLAWTAAAMPDVVVSCIDGREVLAESLDWLRARNVRGYARLVWFLDRLGRLRLGAYSALPGFGAMLAAADGVDFASLWYASVAGVSLPPQSSERRVAQRVTISEPQVVDDRLPLVQPPASWSWSDPLPWWVGLVAGLFRAS